MISEKFRGSWYQEKYFLKLNICVYLRTKCKVSSITLTGFRQGEFFLPPQENEPLKSQPRLRLKHKQDFCLIRINFLLIKHKLINFD